VNVFGLAKMQSSGSPRSLNAKKKMKRAKVFERKLMLQLGDQCLNGD